MKNLVAALALVVLSAAGASAGEVKPGTLSKMGYGDAQAMSDAEGMNVRGKGVVIVGANAVNIGGASVNHSFGNAFNYQKAKATFAVFVLVF